MAGTRRLWAMSEAATDCYIYTVFCRPRDFPSEYVVRRFKIGPGTVTPDLTIWSRGKTLSEVRRTIPYASHWLGRYPQDEAQIVESWI